MATSKPKFKIGDKISSAGAPGLVYEVRNVQTNSDGSGDKYLFGAPNGSTHEIGVDSVDGFFVRNAREFNRQVAIEAAKDAKNDGQFDDDGFPTFESENRP